MGSVRSADERPLRPGDVVEVRSAAEILATLDGESALDQLPFMPEMLAHVGRRYTVSRRVDKVCNTVDATGSRRMHDTVYLEDLRCNGTGHGGCQAGCRIYWKEAWLRRVDDDSAAADPSDPTDQGTTELERLARAATRIPRELKGERVEVWRCQATDALQYSEHLKTSNLAQYWREFRNGNFAPFRYVVLLLRGFVMEVARRLRVLRALPLHGPGAAPPAGLGVQPGDLVQVRSPDEIKSTLDEKGFNRGLSFDREMLPYCGRTFRVKDRVDRIVDDKTGRMLKIPKDSLILEGAVCSGERTPGCWFCPREIYPFWREAWVRPVEESDRPDVTA
ncbi:MAG TPA: hypothetical protein VHR38_04975 [Solirubrobacterales bacterium]|nr:hypothetical protein [Solirubrobacterales bacterium]